MHILKSIFSYFFIFAFTHSLYSQMHIIILGPPGAGKGTLSQQLCAIKKYNHICLGDTLRAEVAKKTVLGKSIEEKINLGIHIDPRITAEIVSKNIHETASQGRYFILDGFPRTPECLPFLRDIITSYNLENNIICIILESSEVRCLQRIEGRLVCNACKYVFNRADRYKLNQLCPHCQQNRLAARPNDKSEVAIKRLQSYKTDIEPVVNNMKSEYRHICIDTNNMTASDCLDNCIKKLHIS